MGAAVLEGVQIAVLVARQQAIGAAGDMVMEGRDIGSVVFPETPYKFYIDASPDIRAQRRATQGQRDEISARDRFDSSRKASEASAESLKVTCPPR